MLLNCWSVHMGKKWLWNVVTVPKACTQLLCQRLDRMHPINLTYFVWTYARAGRNQTHAGHHFVVIACNCLWILKPFGCVWVQARVLKMCTWTKRKRFCFVVVIVEGVYHEEFLQAVADHFCKGWLPTMDRCSLGWVKWRTDAAFGVNCIAVPEVHGGMFYYVLLVVCGHVSGTMVWNFSKLEFRHDRYFELSAQDSLGETKNQREV